MIKVNDNFIVTCTCMLIVKWRFSALGMTQKLKLLDVNNYIYYNKTWQCILYFFKVTISLTEKLQEILNSYNFGVKSNLFLSHHHNTHDYA